MNVILSEDALAGSRAPVLRAAGCHRASESKDPASASSRSAAQRHFYRSLEVTLFLILTS
jgi:hypothetical protein